METIASWRELLAALSAAEVAAVAPPGTATTGWIDAGPLKATAGFLESAGLDPASAWLLARLTLLAAVLVISALVWLVARRGLLRAAKLLASRSRASWDDVLVRAKVFDRLTHLAPALLVYGGAGLVFPDVPRLLKLTQNLSLAYMVLVGALVSNALLSGTQEVLKKLSAARDLPVRSIVQVLKIAIFVVALILILATLMEQDPWGVLTGLGAMTAIVLLVFKDTILGFVGSIQLSLNNMVQVGDWIEMPSFGADGDVIDITLTTVKVQNWDKTISTIPTYALVNHSFKNWRGMSESGGRRIRRSVHIDMTSVRFCDEAMLERLRRFELVRDYLEERGREIEEDNRERNVDTSVPINGRRLTNLGVFRRYVLAYLESRPEIHTGMTLLVRHLEPTEHGLPIQVYAFSRDKVWASYEAIQADIFDHLLAVIPLFDLRVFQSPAGGDVRALAGKLAPPPGAPEGGEAGEAPEGGEGGERGVGGQAHEGSGETHKGRA